MSSMCRTMRRERGVWKMKPKAPTLSTEARVEMRPTHTFAKMTSNGRKIFRCRRHFGKRRCFGRFQEICVGKRKHLVCDVCDAEINPKLVPKNQVL